MARLIYGEDLEKYIISGGDVLEVPGAFVEVSMSNFPKVLLHSIANIATWDIEPYI